MHVLFFVVLLVIGMVNGFINVTGGGGGLITTPLLLALGLSPYTSLATSKFVPIGGLITGGVKYYKAKIVNRNKSLLLLAIIVSLGACIAPNLTLSINEHTLKYIILIFTASILVLTIFSHNRKRVSKNVVKHTSHKLSMGALFWSFIVSIYQGSIGIGGGIFLSFVLRKCMQYTYLESAALMNVLAVLITIISAATFTVKDVVNYVYGIPLFLGSIMGGYLGAHIAIKKGDKLLKIITITVSVALLIKVLIS